MPALLSPGCAPVPPEVQGKVIHKNFVRGVVIEWVRCYIIYRNRIKEQIMVLPEDSSNALCDLLDRIADSLEKNTDILNRIANHYDGVVPVMTRNAKRAESLAEEQESTFAQGIKDIFRPQEN